MPRHLLSTLARLGRSEDGSVLIYTTVAAGVLIGIGTLAIDVGRLSTLHSQMQNAADAAALAGARELDLLPDSHARARAAVAQALNNVKDFSTDATTAITISTVTCATDAATNCIRFLDALPSNDADPVTAAFETTTPQETSFIEVRVAQTGFTALFAGVLGDNQDSAVGARAIAGNDSLICEVPPMFMCNPAELDPTLNLEGRQIQLFMQGASGSYGPGNFGLLCPSGTEGVSNCGAKDIAANLASNTGTCVRRRGMTTKTGVTLQMVRTGINARFDWWLPQAKDDNGNWRDQDFYQPAVNITQGRQPPNNPSGGGTKCDRNDVAANMGSALPRDACILAGTCTAGNGKVGDGNWDSNTYFRINHGTTGTPPADWPTGLPVTRYNVYRYEIEKNRIVTPGKAIQPSGTTQENGNPQCFRGTPPVNDYTYLDDLVRDLRLLNDRRILPIAMLNCVANGVSGKTTFIPDDFLFVFMTEPMGSPSESALYVEVLGSLDGESEQALLRDVVQIYRR
ncbi:MAG: pilus assembly protein TadG-related protein [Rhodospirillaceae bacterium]